MVDSDRALSVVQRACSKRCNWTHLAKYRGNVASMIRASDLQRPLSKAVIRSIYSILLKSLLWYIYIIVYKLTDIIEVVVQYIAVEKTSINVYLV